MGWLELRSQVNESKKERKSNKLLYLTTHKCNWIYGKRRGDQCYGLVGQFNLYLVLILSMFMAWQRVILVYINDVLEKVMLSEIAILGIWEKTFFFTLVDN